MGKSNIIVAVRVRPLIHKELRINDQPCLRVDHNMIVVGTPKSKNLKIRGPSGQKIFKVRKKAEQCPPSIKEAVVCLRLRFY